MSVCCACLVHCQNTVTHFSSSSITVVMEMGASVAVLSTSQRYSV
uniref:Uncharacterized protein n=1 Tax=Anguilla anguilla TaxID=7936 RepID=A0A0E9WSE1_ANGAN